MAGSEDSEAFVVYCSELEDGVNLSRLQNHLQSCDVAVRWTSEFQTGIKFLQR